MFILLAFIGSDVLPLEIRCNAVEKRYNIPHDGLRPNSIKWLLFFRRDFVNLNDDLKAELLSFLMQNAFDLHCCIIVICALKFTYFFQSNYYFQKPFIKKEASSLS